MYFAGQVLYYQLNIDYIIEKYCVNKEKPELQCNGKCHLAKQLQITTPTENHQSTSILTEAFFPVYLQDFGSLDFSAIIIYLENIQNFYYTNNYTHLLSFSIYKPPIC